ncbi:MAG: hypothetical protein OEV95_13345 [Gemmatimonadota bacterium]|nr:hypothetical protein [Gemmatimonadota bacterium]
MPRSRCQRLSSLLLALVLVGGSMGLPLADALIFHAQPGSPAPGETTIGSVGGSQGHQQLCLQLKATGQTRSVPAAGARVPAVPRDQASRIVAPSAVPVSSPAPSCQFSRAPPDTSVTG